MAEQLLLLGPSIKHCPCTREGREEQASRETLLKNTATWRVFFEGRCILNVLCSSIKPTTCSQFKCSGLGTGQCLKSNVCHENSWDHKHLWDPKAQKKIARLLLPVIYRYQGDFRKSLWTDTFTPSLRVSKGHSNQGMSQSLKMQIQCIFFKDLPVLFLFLPLRINPSLFYFHKKMLDCSPLEISLVLLVLKSFG